MATFNRTTSVNPAPGGDSGKQAVLDIDTDLTNAFTHLNTLDSSKAVLTSSISDGDTTHSPDGNSVFDALALKATLGANTFTGEQFFAETRDTVYNITDGANFEIDPVHGNIQTITLGAARTGVATNFAAGQTVLLGVDDGTAYALTWPTMTWIKSGGTGVAPTLATTGYTWVLLWKQGTTLFGSIVGSP